MIIVYFSSVFNHHSMPICDALNSLPGVTCYFVATRKEEEQRKKLGYHAYDRDYVIDMLASEESKEEAHRLALEADVMIASVFPYEFLKERLKKGKLTFICQERMFKYHATIIQRLRAWFFNFRKYRIFKKSPLYFLSIGRGAAQDYESIGYYKGKSFQWAYYPSFIQHDVNSLMAQKERKVPEILFVGRMIECKHPEYTLRASRTLLEKGYKFHLTYVGTGEMEDCLRQEAESLGDAVSFLGSMPPEQVREVMESANIFVFTSNIKEGWGAVVNEAMNSGCAIIADSAPGAVGTLIEDGCNGVVYSEENYDQFYDKLEQLVANPELVRRYGEAAYQTISQNYNAQIAAERFYVQADALLNNKPLHRFNAGPMKQLPHKSQRRGK